MARGRVRLAVHSPGFLLGPAVYLPALGHLAPLTRLFWRWVILRFVEVGRFDFVD